MSCLDPPWAGRSSLRQTNRQTKRQTPRSASAFALTRPEMRRDTLAGPLTGHWPMICSESTSGVARSPSAPFVNRLILKLITCGSSPLLNQLCINETAPGFQGAFVFFMLWFVAGGLIGRSAIKGNLWPGLYWSLRESLIFFNLRLSKKLQKRRGITECVVVLCHGRNEF